MLDQYVLKRSEDIVITANENKVASLKLLEASAPALRLSGTVKVLSAGTPIPNAFVSVFNAAGALAGSTYTDDNGNYNISLEPGTYKVVASAEGYKPAAVVEIVITDTDVVQNFELEAYTDEDRVIYGVISDGTNPINGARIDVKNSAGEIVATTFSIIDGEYAVPLLENGTYSIYVTKEGYNSVTVTDIVISDANPHVNKDVTLTLHVSPDTATISGFITRETDGVSIANAWVGLYTVNSAYELIGTTFTNNEGFYSFIGVDPGNYVVKSKAVG